MSIRMDLSKIETFRRCARQGRANLVADQIAAKFGFPATGADQTFSRVAVAGEAELKTLSIRVLSAGSLTELFDGLGELERLTTPCP